MTTAGLPPIDLSDRRDHLPVAARRTLVLGVAGLHLAAAWSLMQLDVVRQAVSEAAPLFVNLLNPPQPDAPLPPPPPEVRKPPPRREPPVIAAPPTPSMEPPFTVPVVPEPPPPVAVAAPEPPSPAPAAPPPVAPPLAPQTIPATAVRYLEPPAPVYPAASKRARESGRVVLRVEIAADGRAHQVLVSRSSGFSRLDEAAAASLRAARFAPYTENGVALVVWTLVPIEFELEN